ncbi:hypothetical protein JMUB7515_28110 [Staphylococcus aureus]
MYKRQVPWTLTHNCQMNRLSESGRCLLYTSDAADDMQCVDLGGRRIIKKNNLV